MSYWVTSELNPRYIQYRTAIEYYGVYYVITTKGDRVATFDWPGRSHEAREAAYRLARELNKERETP